MDLFAAIALATEAPHPTELKKDRVKKTENFVLPVMWRSITSQALYQALVMLILLYFGPMMFNTEYNLVTTDLYTVLPDNDKAPTYRL